MSTCSKRSNSIARTEISKLLLPWFNKHGRKNLPWQQQVTAYRVWLSEIMLQQTQVSTVIPYFEKFIESFPDAESLANANLDQVLKHWAGLGYYARARNLHKTALIIRDDYQGDFPQNIQQLVDLPGIGRSTAGAILSLAFSQPAAILDGNVKRVLSRAYQVAGWAGQSKTLKQLWAVAEEQTPSSKTANYNQAMMDLGAMVCLRSRPKCQQCPLTGLCQSFKHETQSLYPESKPKKARPHQHRWVLLHKYKNQLLLERRPSQGIWGGLWSLPELEQLETLPVWQIEKMGQSREADGLQKNLIKHKFSHYDLTISLAEIEVSKSFVDSSKLQVSEVDQFQWVDGQELHEFGLPAPISKLLANVYKI